VTSLVLDRLHSARAKADAFDSAALHVAAEMGHLDVCRFLVLEGSGGPEETRAKGSLATRAWP
jgi:hypothetical protein